MEELLRARGRSNYSDASETQGSVASYQRSAVSRHSVNFDAPRVETLLDSGDRALLDDFEKRLLRSDEEMHAYGDELKNTRPYTDPRLKGNRRRYVQFVRDQQDAGMVDFALDIEEEIGIFW